MSYEHTSSFFWDSRLSDARKAQIVAWVKSLKPAEQSMLEDIVRDTQYSTDFDVRSEFEGS
jgi:cell division FtsZ-interacting protein ZapD